MGGTALFLCTGNYYRSRFAEHYFNALCRQRGLAWQASSRGLQPSQENLGAISRYASDRLRAQGIELGAELRMPMDLQRSDLIEADITVAVNEVEHRPMMQARFPDWADGIRYWRVHDLDVTDAETALAAIEEAVRSLIEELSAL